MQLLAFLTMIAVALYTHRPGGELSWRRYTTLWLTGSTRMARWLHVAEVLLLWDGMLIVLHSTIYLVLSTRLHRDLAGHQVRWSGA